MKTLQRYKLDAVDNQLIYTDDPNGDWIMYDDYKKEVIDNKED